MPADIRWASPAEVVAATEQCPKRMVYGPCGGVAADGHCEVRPEPCSFLALGPVALPPPEVCPAPTAGPVPAAPSAAGRLRAVLAAGAMVVADFPAAPMSADSIARCAAELIGSVDAVLLGDAPASRVQFPPAFRTALVRAAGLDVVAGLNCRDRNRVALEGELAALRESDAGAVLCLTGDHPAAGERPDAAAVFDLDSTRLAALARTAGHLVAVAEAPAAPPQQWRPWRLGQKQAAGADFCFVDHCGGAAAVADFARRLSDLGVSVPLVACVPVVIDHASAAQLRSFPALAPPPGMLESVLAAADPHGAGIAAAIAESQALLAIPGVVGVDLSGAPGAGGSERLAAAMAQIAATLRSS